MLWHCWFGVRKSIWLVRNEWWGVGVISAWSEVQIVCLWSSWRHCHPKTPSSLALFKSRLVLPFWYRLTQDVPEKRPLSGCSSSKFYDITDHWAVIIFTLFYCMFVIGPISWRCKQHFQTLLLRTDEPENLQTKSHLWFHRASCIVPAKSPVWHGVAQVFRGRTTLSYL